MFLKIPHGIIKTQETQSHNKNSFAEGSAGKEKFMKKKLLAILLTVAMMIPFVAFQTSAATFTCTYDFDGGEDAVKANSSLIHANNGTNHELSGYALEVKTGKNASTDRRTKLLPLTESGIALPAGTYTISIWMRHNSASSSDWITKGTTINASILLKFYSASVTESGLSKDDHSANEGITVNVIANPNETNNYPSFVKTNDHATTNENNSTKDWYRHEATVTLTEPCTNMAFWMCNSEVTDKDWYAYLDNFSIEVTEAAGATFRGVQEAVNEEKFNVRFVGTLDSYENYEKIGFKIALSGAANKAEKNFACYNVHSSLRGNTATGIEIAYAANDLLGSYIYALTLTDIPVVDTTENYVFTVTPYVVPTGDTEPILGASYIVTYAANGTFVSSVAAPLA